MFYRVTMQFDGTSRSFVFYEEDHDVVSEFAKASEFAQELADDMEALSHEVAVLDLEGAVMELCTF